jgi:hypothetical protein
LSATLAGYPVDIKNMRGYDGASIAWGGTFMKYMICASLLAVVFCAPTTARDTYVQGHYRSAPDANRYNNRSSQTQGGSRRDEFSPGGGATNKRNSTYKWRDNDRDGIPNAYDKTQRK